MAVRVFSARATSQKQLAPLTVNRALRTAATVIYPMTNYPDGPAS